MATLSTRLTSIGTYLVNGTFDEITQATISVTTNTVYASSLDEVTLPKGSSSPAVRQTNTREIQVSTQFDEFTGAPIVDSSLLLWVDAAQPESYPGSGFTWFSLSPALGRNFNINASDFTQERGGAMFLETGDAYGSATSNMTIANAHTVSVWVRPTVEDALIRRYININTGVDGIVLRNDGVVGGALGQLHYYINAGGFRQVRVNFQVVAGQTANFVGTYDGNTMRLYKNGLLIGTTSITATLTSTVNSNYSISSSSEGMIGDFYQAMVYNRALSTDEVQQNFNALRRRYGI